MERRVFGVSELRAEEGDGGERLITGYAAVFDQLSVPLWGFQEEIRQGAFAKTIREGDIRSLWNHDVNYVMGRTKNGTLALREDDHGLWVEIRPPETEWANGFMESIRRGDVDQMSFGFDAVRDAWRDVKGGQVRTLVEVKLYEVSPVTFPAYPQTHVSTRSIEEVIARLGDSDPEEIRALIERLSSLLPADAPGEDAHPEEWRRAMARKRRELELLL